MKRKLVAALLSVAMVASITPVSALGPVAVVEAADAVTVDDVIEQINKLVSGSLGGGVGNPANKVFFTDEYAYYMNQARSNFDALSADQNGQGAVTNRATLENVEKAYKAAYTDKITAAEDAIKAIPDVLTTDSEKIVNEAKDAYGELAQKVQINVAGTGLAASAADLTKGLSTESKTKYENAVAAMAVVKAIAEQVTADKEVTDENYVEMVYNVKDEFAALTAAQQEMVGNAATLRTELERITYYEDQVDAYEKAVKDAITTTKNDQTTVNAVKATEADIAAAEKIAAELKAQRDALSEAQQGEISGDVKDYVNIYATNIANAKTALDVIEKINAIPSTVTAKDILTFQAARDAEEVIDSDVKALVGNTLLSKLSNARNTIETDLAKYHKDEVETAVTEVLDEILRRGQLTSSDEAAVNNAARIYLAWYGDGESVLGSSVVSDALRAKYEELVEKWKQVGQLADKDDQAAAEKIEEQIDALPPYYAVKASDKDAYDAAQKAYDDASDAVKKYVQDENNGEYVKKLAAVKTAVGNALKADVASELKSLISSLNFNGSLDDADKYEQIAQLLATDLTAYLGVNPTLEDYVDDENAAYYKEVKAKYDALVKEAEQEAGKVSAQSVIELINKIPTLKADGTDTDADIKAAEAAIQAAKDAYEKLTVEGKANVSNYARIAEAEANVATAKVYPLAKDIKTIYGYEITDATEQGPNLTEAQYELIKAAEAVYPAKDSSDEAILKKLNTTQELEAFPEAVKAANEYRRVQSEAEKALETEVGKVTEANINAMTLANRSDYDAILKAYEALGAQAKADFADSEAYATYQKIVAKYNSFELAYATVKVEKESVVYNGDAQQVNVTVTDSLGNVVDPSIYKVTYRDNTDVGTATVKVTGNGDSYTGVQTATFEITAADINDAEITVSNKTYTGEAVTTTVKAIANGDDVLEEGKDFEITSYENNTNVGKATVTIEGKGNYAGTISKNFIVKPGRVAVTSFTAGTKKAVVKFEGQPGASYKVTYALAGTTQYKYVYTTNLSKTLTSLKSGKKYKVKVLAYYKADGKTYYTGYGSYKTVKVK